VTHRHQAGVTCEIAGGLDDLQDHSGSPAG
jgi:hypothetical protein